MSLNNSVYWIGQDGNVWLKSINGTENMGKPTGQAMFGGVETQAGTVEANYINDPSPGGYPSRTQGAATTDGYSTTSGTSGTTSGRYSPTDEAAYYTDQISSLDRLLGLTNTQQKTGLDNLALQRTRLGDEKTKAMNGYNDQVVQSGQDKQRGVEQVDQFANNSYNSLQRLLQGGNAGNSSVGRELIPYLVSKGAGTRRQGVFDQAGKNDQAIAVARGDAEDQFKFNEEELGGQEKSFREGILNKQNELEGQKRALEIQRAQATGAGYATARAAGEASQNSINSRMDQLNALFGQFKPSYRAANLKTPELGRYTVDPAQIRSDQSLPAESRYYQSQLKKKQEELV